MNYKIIQLDETILNQLDFKNSNAIKTDYHKLIFDNIGSYNCDIKAYIHLSKDEICFTIEESANTIDNINLYMKNMETINNIIHREINKLIEFKILIEVQI